MSSITSFSDIWDGPSFLERGASASRMRARDEAGKQSKKKPKEKRHEHFNKDWDADLWD